MQFEWDEAKHQRCRQERGFGFDDAARIFAGRVVERPDGRRDYGESRLLAVGAADGVILAVVYTVRGTTTRIISARRASRKERELWRTRG